MVRQKMANLGKQMGVVINLSGLQRMLTQKMTKEFLLIAARTPCWKTRLT